jgi:hypothetical protein
MDGIEERRVNVKILGKQTVIPKQAILTAIVNGNHQSFSAEKSGSYWWREEE